MKFKVGDKVRVMVEESVLFGRCCFIVDVKNANIYPYEVKCEYGYDIFKEEELELIEDTKEIKDIRLDKLKQLIKAVNTLGEFGKEVELKITIELDGKKIEL